MRISVARFVARFYRISPDPHLVRTAFAPAQATSWVRDRRISARAMGSL